MSLSNNKKQPEVQLKVAFYIRVSTEDQAEKFGIDLQRATLESLIKSRVRLEDGRDAMVLAGKGNEHIYIDADISGSTELDERPAFARLKEDILLAPEGQQPFDVVAVYKIDRFARRLKVLLEVIEFFDQYNIKFLSANESIDTSTPFGRAMLGIIGVIAELEIETTKQRTTDGRLAAVQKGVIMGPAATFGFVKNPEKKLEILEEEAEVVKLIFDKFVHQRNTASQIANYLTLNEYPTPDASAVKNKKRKGEIKKKNEATFWRDKTIRTILANDLYIGKYYFGKTKNSKQLSKENWQLSEYRYPSIIDTFTFEKAQILLSQAKQMANAKQERVKHLYLLSSLLRCDCCREHEGEDERLMTWVGDPKKITNKTTGQTSCSYSYRCGRKSTSKHSVTCRSLPIPAEPLEKYIANFMMRLLQNPLPVFNHQQQLQSTKLEIENLTKRKEYLRELMNNIPLRIERLKEQHEIGQLTTPELEKKIEEIQNKKHTHESELQRLENVINQNTISQGYLRVFESFSPTYVKMLEKVSNNRQEIFDLLHLMVDKIIVFCRPTTSKDVIAGIKKKDQQLPYKIEIRLKLPQEILQSFYGTDGFGVKNLDL